MKFRVCNLKRWRRMLRWFLALCSRHKKDTQIWILLIIATGNSVLMVLSVSERNAYIEMTKDFEEAWILVQQFSLRPPPDTPEAKRFCMRKMMEGALAECLDDVWARYAVDGENAASEDEVIRGLWIVDLPERITYIKLNSFRVPASGFLYEEIKKRLLQNENEAHDRHREPGFILDLRYNTGGHEVVAETVNFFFAEDPEEIIFTLTFRGREPMVVRARDVAKRNGVYGDRALDEFRNVKIVLLANVKTASAAELVALFLQTKGKKIIGEKTFGKAVAQTKFSLTESKDEIFFSIARILVGNAGLDIHGNGVEPDYVVPADSEKTREKYIRNLSSYSLEKLAEGDPQFQKAYEIIQSELLRKE